MVHPALVCSAFWFCARVAPGAHHAQPSVLHQLFECLGEVDLWAASPWHLPVAPHQVDATVLHQQHGINANRLVESTNLRDKAASAGGCSADEGERAIRASLRTYTNAAQRHMMQGVVRDEHSASVRLPSDNLERKMQQHASRAACPTQKYIVLAPHGSYKLVQGCTTFIFVNFLPLHSQESLSLLHRSQGPDAWVLCRVNLPSTFVLNQLPAEKSSHNSWFHCEAR